MLSHYFHARRLRAAVRRCQLLLGPQVRRDDGTANEYTLDEITQAMQRAKLAAADFELACAALMPEAAFAATPAPDARYASHRALLERYATARGPLSGVAPAAVNSYALSAAINTWLSP